MNAASTGSALRGFTTCRACWTCRSASSSTICLTRAPAARRLPAWPAIAERPEGYGAPADDPLSKRETLELVRAYYRITDPSVRKRVFDLIKSMGPTEAN